MNSWRSTGVQGYFQPSNNPKTCKVDSWLLNARGSQYECVWLFVSIFKQHGAGDLSNVSLTISVNSAGIFSTCFHNSFCAKLKASHLLPLSSPVHPDSVVCSSSVTRLKKSLCCPTARWVTARFKSTFTVKSQDLIFHLFFFSFLIVLKILSWTTSTRVSWLK